MQACHWIAALLATLGLAGVAREGVKRAWEPRAQLEGAEDRSDNREHHHHHPLHGWHHHWQPATADAEFCSDVMEVKMCHARCGHDGACHKACPMPKDADLQTKLVEKMECHDKCGDDRECHRACGCPFQQLHEKCPMLNMEEHHHHHHHHHGWHHHWQPATADAEFCSDVMEVKMCHARCGHDGVCHKACPMPKDADLQTKLVKKMECHDKCGDDRECHRACGCPFQQLREKCPMLNMEEHFHHHGWHHYRHAATKAEFCADVMQVKTCHDNCGLDRHCHKACPLPEDAALQTKLVESMECHENCQYDGECHRDCGCPFEQLRDKCPMLFAPFTDSLPGQNPDMLMAVHV